MPTAGMPIAAMLGEDVVAALAALHLDPLEADCITGLPGRGVCATFRVRLADGRVVKVRRLRRAARAERYARNAQALAHEQVRPPLLVVGRVAVEAWVDGTPVSTMPPSPERLARAADLLRTIHLGPRPHRDRPHRHSTGGLVAGTRRRIAALGDHGVLAAAEVSTLVAFVSRLAPGAADIGTTHNDFCAENLVEEPSGRLVVVDNEGLRQGFFDYDLARTWYRWPMPAGEWDAFVARYGSSSARFADSDPTFWRIAAMVKSAHLRAVQRRGNAETPVERLRSLIAGR